jgi:hypothetical protein
MQYKEEWIGLGIPLSQSLPVGGCFLKKYIKLWSERPSRSTNLVTILIDCSFPLLSKSSNVLL